VGGIKFTVRDGETGYLVPPDDPKALAERLAHLYKHPKLLALFRRQAIRRVNDLFTWQKVTSAVAALYEEVLAARQPRGRDEAESMAMVDRRFDAVFETLYESRRALRSPIVEAAKLMACSFGQEGKLLVCANGRGALEAQQVTSELVGRFKSPDRPGLPAIALTADQVFLARWSNENGHDHVFARQVEAFGHEGDVLLAIETAGSSVGLVRALEVARRRGLRSIVLAGGSAGDVRNLSDVAIVVPSNEPEQVQAVQRVVIHSLCEIVQERLAAGRVAATAPASAAHTLWEVPARCAGDRGDAA
jgi:phosphoheptose isomerase